MNRLIRLLLSLLFLLPVSVQAAHYGIQLSYGLIKTEPPTLNGYQLMLHYDPGHLRWYGFKIYFDGGFSHFSISNRPYYTTLNIYSIAPVLRYQFLQQGLVLPYFELSLGIAYLNHTRLDSRNLGIHFAFQDRIGIGLLFGTTKQFSLGLHAVHYSNAHLANHNSGITMPLVLDLGYQFN